MAFPPPLPPGDRLNDTVSSDNHPDDHNMLVAALEEWAVECGDDLKGPAASLTARLDELNSYWDNIFSARAQEVIGSGFGQVITEWDTVARNPAGWDSTGGAITPTKEGVYLVQAASELVTPTAFVGQRRTSIQLNGVEVGIPADDAEDNGTETRRAQSVYAQISCNGIDDKIRVAVRQRPIASGGAGTNRTMNVSVFIQLVGLV